MKPLTRYWRYGIAAVAGLAVGAIFRGTLGMILGVVIVLSLILILERRVQRVRR